MSGGTSDACVAGMPLPACPPAPLLRSIAVIVAIIAGTVGPTILAAQQEPDRVAAIAAFDARRYGEAEAAFVDLLRRSPGDGEALHYLGRLAMRNGDNAAARRLLEQAVRTGPASSEHHRWLGRVYAQEALHAGMFRRAALAGRIRRSFERAVELDPLSIGARMDLLQFLLAAPGVAGGSVRAARAQAEAVQRLSPMEGAIARGLLAEKLGDDAKAEQEYENARRSHPDSAAPLLALGAMYQRTGRAAEAFGIYDRVQRSHPGETQVLYQVGRTASISGLRLEEGVRALRRYLEIPTVEGTPLPASAHYRLGLIYERQHRADDAIRQLETARRLEPARHDVRTALERVRASSSRERGG